jgi:hypothetical protein
VYVALDGYSGGTPRNEDLMNPRQEREVSHFGSRDSLIDKRSGLARENAALLEDNEDLRASALWWKALYEESQRRCADLEHWMKAVGFSSPAHIPRCGTASRSP